jgi:hypothetical protein
LCFASFVNELTYKKPDVHSKIYTSPCRSLSPPFLFRIWECGSGIFKSEIRTPKSEIGRLVYGILMKIGNRTLQALRSASIPNRMEIR